MDTKVRNGLIVVGVTIGVAGGLYFAYTKFSGMSKSDSFNLVPEKIGKNATKTNDGKWRLALTNHYADFDKDGNYIIYTKGKEKGKEISDSKFFSKGKYINGGTIFHPENGEDVKTGSIWQNVANLTGETFK